MAKRLTVSTQFQRPRPIIKVGVGYTWDGDIQSDKRWHALRTCLNVIAKEALKRASQELSHQITFDDEKVPKTTTGARKQHSDKAAISVRRLRATTGSFTWESICKSISNSEALIFDITPTKPPEKRGYPYTVSPNVWMELGYALGLGKKVFVVHRDQNGHHSLPSDLQGLIVGLLPDDGKARDQSLRMALVNHLRDAILGEAI